MSQSPSLDMTLSGPPLLLAVEGLFSVTMVSSPALVILAATQTTLTVNGPSSLLLEDESRSGFLLSVLTLQETVPTTTSLSTMGQMPAHHPSDHTVEQTLG